MTVMQLTPSHLEDQIFSPHNNENFLDIRAMQITALEIKAKFAGQGYRIGEIAAYYDSEKELLFFRAETLNYIENLNIIEVASKIGADVGQKVLVW